MGLAPRVPGPVLARPLPSRRDVIGASSALGVSLFVLPTAAVAASVSGPSVDGSGVDGWSTTLTFTDVTASGFTVTWTPVA
jgi:hypothetical protein